MIQAAIVIAAGFHVLQLVWPHALLSIAAIWFTVVFAAKWIEANE